MSLNIVPNEIILYMGDFFAKPSLNALIQTQKRFATLLMPHLCDDEIRFKVEHPEIYDDSPDLRFPRPIKCLDCASRWRSDIMLFYLSSQPRATFALTDSRGRTLLHRIAMKGNSRLMDILLAKGANIEARDGSNCTPLMAAVKGKNEELVDALLNTGANVTAYSSRRVSVLVQAIFTQSLSIVRRVIQSLKATTNDIFAPCTSSDVLRRAIYFGSKPIIQLLLDLGADYSVGDIYGTTALISAAIHGCSDAVNLLLDRGADVLLYDTLGRSALTSSAQKLDFATVQRLVKATITRGNINLRSGEEGWTPLHHFALHGNIAGVELLINSGADVLVMGENGVTPLTCSLVRYEDDETIYEEVCQALIKAMSAAGADFSVPSEVPTGSGWTPLHLAANLGAESIVGLLIENGADIFALDASQCLPLVLALWSGHEFACLLLAKEMRARGHDFSTALPSLPETTGPTNTFFDLAVSHKMGSLCALLNDSKT